MDLCSKVCGFDSPAVPVSCNDSGQVVHTHVPVTKRHNIMLANIVQLGRLPRTQEVMSQSLYAIKVLRCHDMNEKELRLVYKSVVLAKLMYALPAWWGFATAADKKRIEAFVQRGVRLGLYLANDPMPTELATDSNDNLFGSVLYNCHHVGLLKQLLPDKTDHQYNLRHIVIITCSGSVFCLSNMTIEIL